MKKFRVISGVAAGLVALALAAPAAAADLTVGHFFVEVAKAKDLSFTDAASARDAIVADGTRVPSIDINKTLTQGDVVRLSSALGLNLRSSTPDALFTDGDMTAFVSAFAPEIGGDEDYATEGDKPKVDPREKGKGKKKGLFRSPSEPI